MSKRKDTPRNRAFHPRATVLESRQLLSGVVSGTDIDGDTWTLQLIGPGTLSVVKQNDSSGNPSALNSATEINTIQTGGTDPMKSKLVGTVTKGANGDGKVFFQSMSEIANRSPRFTQEGLGLVAIDMPNFWLGNTTPVTSQTTSTPKPSIDLPDGVNTLRFGGVDTTHNQATATSTSTSDMATVVLGLPGYGGTRIIIDKSITSAVSVPPASGSTSTTPTVVQHGVDFAVSGRLDLFQANEIDGNGTLPPGQFTALNSAASGTGGTIVVSGTAGEAPFFTSDPQLKGALTGAIGNVRIGGNATNFTTLVTDGTGSGNDKIANFSVGGETQNVMLVAPGGSRTLYFGKGMDTVEVRSRDIVQLQANRGALNSTVVTDHQINGVNFGGDVVNTPLVTGVVQNFTNIINQVEGQSSSIFSSSSPSSPEVSTAAQDNGHISARVAGDVTNSTFAASVVPFNGVYGDPNQIVIPSGNIKGKVQGTINNSAIAPNAPSTAFFAHKVTALAGPVVPPNVPQPPYASPQPTRLPGIPHPNFSHAAFAQRHAATHKTATVTKQTTTRKA